MKPEEIKELTESLAAVYDLYGKTLSPAATRLWASALHECELSAVLRALEDHVAGSTFLPKPADILDLLSPNEWPGAGQAWALALKDERETGATCPEMLSAWSVAFELWTSGDKIGARRAFEGAWERAVQDAVRAGRRRPVWSLSVGWDAAGCAHGAQRAVDKGLLTRDSVAGYLDDQAAAQDQRLLGQLPAANNARGHLRSLGRILGGTPGEGAPGNLPPGAAGVGGGESPGDVGS